MQSEPEAMLLDRYLPQYDVTETHAVVIDADTELTWQAVRRSDLSRSAVIRVLLELRSLPNRLQGVLKGRPSEPSRPPLMLDDMERAGFLLLGERPGHEIVFGSVVQPWKAVTDDEPAPRSQPVDSPSSTPLGTSRSPSTSGWSPTAMGAPLITTETRTAATDSTSLHHFARYWMLVGPFSALIRRLMLRIVKSDAERRPWPHGQHPPTRRVSLVARRGRLGDDSTPETADHCPQYAGTEPRDVLEEAVTQSGKRQCPITLVRHPCWDCLLSSFMKGRTSPSRNA